MLIFIWCATNHIVSRIINKGMKFAIFRQKWAVKPAFFKPTSDSLTRSLRCELCEIWQRDKGRRWRRHLASFPVNPQRFLIIESITDGWFSLSTGTNQISHKVPTLKMCNNEKSVVIIVDARHIMIYVCFKNILHFSNI